MAGTDAEVIVDLLVRSSEHCVDHRLGKHQNKRQLELITVTFLACSSKKPKVKALLMSKQTTQVGGVETPLYLLRLPKVGAFAHAQLVDSSRR